MASYESILDRVGLLVTANLNAILDKALGANSAAVFDEYVNRMNGALGALESAEGVERGRAKTLHRQITELQMQVEQMDDDVDRLLGKGERQLAGSRQAVLNTKSQLLQQMKDELTNSQQEIGKLANSRAKLLAQIEISQAKRQQLVSYIEQKKAAELRYQAQSGAHVSTPDRLRTDEILEKARRELEIAEGKNEAAAATLDAQIDQLLETDEIELQLQAREEKMLGTGQRESLPEPKQNS
ncbi:MAG: PspA/IM30 family protein [Chloroflexota bacterium]